MTKSLSIKIFSLLLIILSVSTVVRGEDLKYDFDLSADSTGWIRSKNVSQLNVLNVEQVGRAYVSYEYMDGKLQNYNRADKINNIKVLSEAYYKLNKETMLYGLVSYTNRKEKDVVGSAFLDPSFMPFDITFMDETNTGDRNMESYRLLGAISHNITKRLAVGGKVDFNAINMARTKDLRHTNKILDLYVNAGASYQVMNNLKFGLSYSYKRYVEGLNFNVYGTTDQQYMSLINFGAFSGKQELFDSNGYTAKGSNTPFVEHRHDFGWQTAWKITSKLRLFNELIYSPLNGYFGSKSSNSIVYTEHDGNDFTDKLTFIYSGKKNLQFLNLEFQSYKNSNNENSWRKETSSSGNTITEYYGQNLVGEKKFLKLGASYSIEWGNINNAPVWKVDVGTYYLNRNISSIIYPYYTKQDLNLFEQRANIYHQRNFGFFNLMLGAGIKFRNGTGDKKQEGVYVETSSDAGSPKKQEYFLNSEYDYLTSDRLSPEIMIRLTWVKNKIGYFISLNYDNEFKISSGQKDYNQKIGVKLGVNF